MKMSFPKCTVTKVSYPYVSIFCALNDNSKLILCTALNGPGAYVASNFDVLALAIWDEVPTVAVESPKSA